MKPHCPVCSHETEEAVCGVCGFTQPLSPFLDKRQAEQYLAEVVAPYREAWQALTPKETPPGEAAAARNGFHLSGTELDTYTGKGGDIVIPDGITVIGFAAFRGCHELTGVTIPPGVRAIRWGAFENCSGLTGIVIPEGVETIGPNAFAFCTGLLSVTIPESVEVIGAGAFAGCTALTVLKIPSGVRAIESGTFSGCRSLLSVTIPPGVMTIDYKVFTGCDSLAEIRIGRNSPLERRRFPGGIPLIETDFF